MDKLDLGIGIFLVLMGIYNLYYAIIGTTFHDNLVTFHGILTPFSLFAGIGSLCLGAGILTSRAIISRKYGH